MVALTDSAGALVNTYRYDPYGRFSGGGEAVPNHLRYAGHYQDFATGLYQSGARYYD